MKEIQFTKHAEEKLSERDIDKEIVASAIQNPDERILGRDDTIIAHKGVGGKMLRAIFREEQHHYIVITAYFTTKERYEVNE